MTPDRPLLFAAEIDRFEPPPISTMALVTFPFATSVVQNAHETVMHSGGADFLSLTHARSAYSHITYPIDQLDADGKVVTPSESQLRTTVFGFADRDQEMQALLEELQRIEAINQEIYGTCRMTELNNVAERAAKLLQTKVTDLDRYILPRPLTIERWSTANGDAQDGVACYIPDPTYAFPVQYRLGRSLKAAGLFYRPIIGTGSSPPRTGDVRILYFS